MSCPATRAAKRTLRLRADAWMPYHGDPAAERPGYAVPITRAIFARYNLLDWKQTARPLPGQPRKILPKPASANGFAFDNSAGPRL